MDWTDSDPSGSESVPERKVAEDYPGIRECPFPKLYPSQLNRDDVFFMSLAYNQAIEAWREDEVPVGAVVVHEGQVVASAHNQVLGTGDATAHAEMIAITQASRAIGDWRLNAATLYVTKEPCPMCSGAAIMARLGRLVYAFGDPRMGCLGGATDLNALPDAWHHVEVLAGVLEDECRTLVQAYFFDEAEGEQRGQVRAEK